MTSNHRQGRLLRQGLAGLPDNQTRPTLVVYLHGTANAIPEDTRCLISRMLERIELLAAGSRPAAENTLSIRAPIRRPSSCLQYQFVTFQTISEEDFHWSPANANNSLL